MFGRERYYHACEGYFETLNYPSSRVITPSYNGSCKNHRRQSLTVLNALEDYMNVLCVLRTLNDRNVLKNVATSYLKDILRYMGSLECHKNFLATRANAIMLPIGEEYMRFLKFELIQYSLKDGNYALKLRCMTFQETNVSECRYVFTKFMKDYLKRDVTLKSKVKWSFCGSPNMSVIWVATFPQYVNDSNGYRTSLLNEEWNCYYGECDKRKIEKKVGFMDYIRRIASLSKSTHSHSQISKSHSRRSSSDIDDVVFMKFSDKDDVHRRFHTLSFFLYTFLFVIISIFLRLLSYLSFFESI